MRPQAHTPCPGWGPDAPTTARMVGLPPRVGQYFLSKRKKVPKKARGTATPGKRLLLPILMAGLAMSRAMKLDSFHKLLERARARLFPPSKWAGLFPSAAYRRSAPPQLARGRLKNMRVEMLRRRLDGFATSISRLVFQFEVGNVLTRPMMLEKLHRILAIFAMRKASVESNPRWPLLRAMRPVAEWRSFLFN